ncbi:hypothetical protein ABPG74_009980 [Tetrahymena malaccensis]
MSSLKFQSYYFTKQTLTQQEDNLIFLINQNEDSVFSFLRIVCLILSCASVFFYYRENSKNLNIFTIIILLICTPPRVNLIVHIEVDYQVDSIISLFSTLKFVEIIKYILINNEYYRKKHSFWFSIKSLNQFNPLMLISSITLLFIFVFSYIIFVLELNKQPEQFNTILQSAYFVIIAVTTVGYGDLIPKTYLGKIFTNFLCLSGQVLLSLLVIILISLFNLTEQDQEKIKAFERPYSEDNQFRMMLGRVDIHSNISKVQQGILGELEFLIESLEYQKQQQETLKEFDQAFDDALLELSGHAELNM